MDHSTLDIFKCYSLLWSYIQLAAVFDRWNTRPVTFSDAIYCFDERESFLLYFYDFCDGHHVCSWYYKWLHSYFQHKCGCVDSHYVVIYRTRVHKNMNVPPLLSHPLLKLCMLMVFWIFVPCGRWVFRRFRGRYCVGLQVEWFWFTWILKW